MKNEEGRRQKLINCLMFTAYYLLCSASLSLGTTGGGEESHPSVFQAYFWPVMNFLLLVGILAFLFKKVDIRGYFKKRTELIEQTLREAQEAKELAQKALTEVEERLKLKDKEIEKIVSAARQSGEKEKARMIEEGEKLKDDIIKNTKTNIDYEVKSARDVIKAEAVEIAMELAEKKLKGKLTREEQLKLLEESLAKLEGKD
jgi:F-type H+-transporting ATPase subunit b